MGVNTFLLDRYRVTLLIGGTRQAIGTLRRFFKVTELDDKRTNELTAASEITPSPLAVMLADVSELPLANDLGKPVAAHLVLGWDEGRGSVTDFGWDYLPQLGYAVRETATGDYVLHEEQARVLHAIDVQRARDLGLIDIDGRLLPHGQPRIVICRSVMRWGEDYAEAQCTFDNGSENSVLTRMLGGELPPEVWFVGKRPMDVDRYPPEPVAGTGT